MIVAQRAGAEQLDLEHDAVVLHQPDPEPTRHLCFHCLRPVIHATVNGETVVADIWEWLPSGECLSCAHTRHAHKGTHVRCNRCNGTGRVGESRPPGRMLAIDVAWGDTLHLRLIGENTDRRRGESLHRLHICGEDFYG